MRQVWFPISEVELSTVEASLGTALPARYKASLLDGRLRSVLAHPSVSSFWTGMTMTRFAEFTAVLRTQQPELPTGAVVAAAVVDHETGAPVFRGYWRIWLPEKDDPNQLGPMVYSWDAVKRRKTKDCTVDAWLDTVVRVVAAADPGHLDAVGYPRPAPERAQKPLLSAFPLGGGLEALVQLRGLEAREHVNNQGDAWLDCGVVELRGPAWCVCDGATTPASSGLTTVRAPQGSYQVQVQVAWRNDAQRVVLAAMRLVIQGASVESAQNRGHVDVDHATVAVHDRSAFLKAVSSAQRTRAEAELELLPAVPCVVDVKGRTQFVLVPSGSGDGTYPVNVLLDAAGAAVGVEVLFPAAPVAGHALLA